MNGKAAALGYLIVRTTRNRIVKQGSRVRNPRYAFALLFGLGYFYLTFFRRGALPQGGSGNIFTAMHGIGLTLLVFVSVVTTWLLGLTGNALAFLPAEVQFLLPAPLSRRQLLVYRMVRAQLVLLLNGFIWSILLRRFGLALTPALTFVTAWAGFSVLSLHQLGAALVLAQPARGIRRITGWLLRGAAAAAVVAVIAGLLPLRDTWAALNIGEAMQQVGRTLTSPPISTVLAPFQLLTAPLLATSFATWLPAIGAVLAIIALHVAWILGMEVEFADVAVVASAKRAERLAAMKAARGGTAVAPKTGKVTRQWLPLAPTGNPAIAIAWKNTMSLIRGLGMRTIIVIAAVGIPFVVMSQSMGSADKEAGQKLAALPYLLLTGMTLLMGPRMLRNDLRQDLLRLSTLKTYPLKGSALVAGEILSPTLVLTGFQLLMLTLAYTTVAGVSSAVAESGLSRALFVLVPFTLLALNALNTTIQNGLTLMFPSWIRLGSDSGGIEAMGQNLLVTFGTMFALMLALLLPVGAAVAMVALLHFAVGADALGAAIAAGTTVGVLLLLGEVVAMVGIFGRTFERIDPTQIG